MSDDRSIAESPSSGVPRFRDEGPQADVDILDTSAAGGLLVRGGAIRFAGILGMLGLSVVMAAVLTRHLGVARFGQYTTVMSLVGVVAAITDAGMSNIGTREYAVLRGEERDSMLQDLLALRLVLTFLGVGLATAFAAIAGYDTALLLGTVAGSLATVPLVVQHSLSIPLTAQLRLGSVAALELVRQALWVGGIVVLVSLGAGVLPLLSVPLPVNLALILPTALIVRERGSVRLVLRPHAWPKLLRAAVVFSLATAVGTIYIYTAQIVTSLVASSHQSGLFAVSFRVFAVSAIVPGMLAAAALPLLARAARDDHVRLAYAVDRVYQVSLISGAGAAVAMSAGARFIVSVVAGPKFAASAAVLEVQAFALIASFLAACWSYSLLSLQLFRGLLVANAAALVVSTVMTLALASTDGAQGAAIATICGEATLALGTLMALAWRRPAYRPRVAPMIKVAGVTVCAALISLMPTVPAIVRPIVAIVVYGGGIIATRAAPSELKELLPGPWRR